MAKKEETKMTMQGIIVTGVIIVIAIFLLFSIFSAPTKTNDTTKQTNVNMVLLMDDDAIKGSVDAPITIVEFSDYECPACQYFFKTTMSQLKTKYIDTGIVKFIYRDFPLGFHLFAQKAAEAAECAGEQGKYYEMHDKLFGLGVKGGVEEYKEYAKDLNLNSDEFNTCLDSGKMAIETSKDMIDGSMAGVTGTPAFFVNGVFVSGAQGIQVFDKIIQDELRK